MSKLLLTLTAALASCTSAGPATLNCKAFLAERDRLMISIDTNKDGMIDRAEWSPVESEAFRAIAKVDSKYNSTSNPDDIARMFAELDVDRNSMITFPELTQGLCPR
jgi:Ca2+-binding EF-hand superfamily protein